MCIVLYTVCISRRMLSERTKKRLAEENELPSLMLPRTTWPTHSWTEMPSAGGVKSCWNAKRSDLSSTWILCRIRHYVDFLCLLFLCFFFKGKWGGVAAGLSVTVQVWTETWIGQSCCLQWLQIMPYSVNITCITRLSIIEIIYDGTLKCIYLEKEMTSILKFISSRILVSLCLRKPWTHTHTPLYYS